MLCRATRSTHQSYHLSWGWKEVVNFTLSMSHYNLTFFKAAIGFKTNSIELNFLAQADKQAINYIIFAR